MQQKLRSFDLFIEYKLKNYLELDDGLWNKQIEFPTDVEIMFDDEINTVYANLRPIDVSNSDGINCIGCVVSLAFFDNESGMKILIDDLSENVNVLSNGEIFDVEFSSELRQLDFKTEKNDQLITLEIPLEIMLYPFEVYLTEEEDTVLDQIDKIRKTEINQEDTHSTVAFRTSDEGVVSITGATMEQHQKKIEQNKKMQQTIQEIVPKIGIK